jgi:GT2 family glycosyltransferase
MKLSVILVISHEKVPVIQDALRSVLASQAPFAFEVIVVDNHAPDAEAKLEPFKERVRVIHNSENLGFSCANNRGAQLARGEFLLFLNSDTRVFPDTFARLVHFAEGEPRVGAVGPLVLNADGTFQLSYGAPLSVFSELRQKVWATPASRRSAPESRKTREVGWVSGCCLLTRSEYFPDHKVFDEGIFLYFDDSELCARLRRAGKRVFFFPEARIVHLGGASVSAIPARIAVEYRRSQLYVYRKHLPQWQSLALTFYLSLKYRWKLLKCRDDDERSATVQILALLKKG